jgi:hypothetical protein
MISDNMCTNIQQFEKNFDIISNQWENDIMKSLSEWEQNLISIDDSEKTAIIERHAMCLWADDLKVYITTNESKKFKTNDNIFSRWRCIKRNYETYSVLNIDIRRFIRVVLIENIDLAFYYFAKGIVYETPEDIEKRHKNLYNKKHHILNNIFECVTIRGSVNMMKFIWNIAIDPHIDLCYYNLEYAGNKNARLFLAIRMVEKKWLYENFLDVPEFLQFVKDEGHFDTYKFLLDKDVDDIQDEDYKDIFILAVKHEHCNIYNELIKRIGLYFESFVS